MARPVINTFDFHKKLTYVRRKLKLTHDGIALRSGTLDRSEVIRIGKGKHKLTSDESRDGIARGLGVSRELIDRLLSGRGTQEELLAAVERASAKSAPPPLPEAVSSVDPKIVVHSHPAMRWRATLELVAEVTEEGEALRAMLRVQDLSTDATWGDYYAAAKRNLGVDFAQAPGLSPLSAGAPRVNSRPQKNR